MTFEEISAAITRGHTAHVEDAFKALVDYPGHAGRIDGATPDRLTATLEAVCDGSFGNDRLMPGDTVEAIQGIIPDETALLGGCYSHGALVVKRFLPRWRRSFASA